MIEIASIKNGVEVIGKICEIISGAKKSSKEEFDSLIGMQFLELRKVSESYFSLYSDLRLNISQAKYKNDIITTLQPLDRRRDSIAIDRDSLIIVFLAYKDILTGKKSNEVMEHFINFLIYTYLFFFSAIHETTNFDINSLLSTETPHSLLPTFLARIAYLITEETEGFEHLKFEKAKKELLEMLDIKMTELQLCWKKAMYYYAKFSTNKDELYDIFAG